MKEYLADPSKFGMAAAAPPANAVSEKTETKQGEEDDEMGFDLTD